MYTRCPECQTAFNITVAQLKARDGLVRCGRCDSVFRADLRLFAAPATDVPHGETSRETEIRFTFLPDDDSEYIDIGESDEIEIPVVSDLSLFQAPRRGPPTVVWLFGALLMALLLVGQFGYFYRNELAQLPRLRPTLVKFCELAHCKLAPIAPRLVPELIKTRIAPHPRYANILRIRASMVNRADAPLPPPLMEVTLTDNDGRLLARRTFTPREYLGSRTAAATPLRPNVVVNALLDVTDPDDKATGFEVHLLPQQQPTRRN
jgi:predicted Zn finger-like uncharacterized protein